MPERTIEQVVSEWQAAMLQDLRERVAEMREARLRLEALVDLVFLREEPAARPELRLVVDNAKGGD